MKVKTACVSTAVTLVFALLAHSAAAELSKDVRKQIKKDIQGKKVYARIDIPHKSGRHAWGTYKAPLVEVTPEGHNTDAAKGFTAGAFHADSTFWGTMPNAKLQVEDISFDEDTVEVEFEGLDDAENASTVILFRGIESIDDFRKAWDIAVSATPLQDAHDDWSDEVKTAIASRRLLEGMNKRQAFYVVGTPERFDKSEEDGKTVEIWHTRQDRGTKMGFWYSHGEEAAYPSTLTFIDGTLTEIGTVAAKGLDLDE